jgi:hypothetical protein
MAKSKPIVLNAAEWIPAAEWAAAPESIRRRYINRVRELALARKTSEINRGIGADGQRLRPVRSRPDGATGPPLSPHRPESRTRLRLRGYVGKGHVTLTWTHGWLTILTYHAEGAGHLPERDTLGISPAGLKKIQADARLFWRTIIGGRPAPIPAAARPPRLPSPRTPPGTIPLAAQPLAAKSPHLAQFLRTPGAPGPPRPKAPPKPAPTR